MFSNRFQLCFKDTVAKKTIVTDKFDVKKPENAINHS